MKKMKVGFISVMCLTIFIITMTTVQVNASDEETTVVGQSSGQMTVFGDLTPQNSEEPEEVDDRDGESEKDKDKDTVITQEDSDKKQGLNSFLPKTNEKKMPIVTNMSGIFLLIIALLYQFNRIKLKKSRKR